MRINDQSAAIKLAICDDIGERSYDVSEVAAILVQILARLPAIGMLHYIYKKLSVLDWDRSSETRTSLICLLYLIFRRLKQVIKLSMTATRFRQMVGLVKRKFFCTNHAHSSFCPHMSKLTSWALLNAVLSTSLAFSCSTGTLIKQHSESCQISGKANLVG